MHSPLRCGDMVFLIQKLVAAHGRAALHRVLVGVKEASFAKSEIGSSDASARFWRSQKLALILWQQVLDFPGCDEDAREELFKKIEEHSRVTLLHSHPSAAGGRGGPRDANAIACSTCGAPVATGTGSVTAPRRCKGDTGHLAYLCSSTWEVLDPSSQAWVCEKGCGRRCGTVHDLNVGGRPIDACPLCSAILVARSRMASSFGRGCTQDNELAIALARFCTE